MDTMADRGSVTLRDVAEAAGVSVSTVSRVLDERAPRSQSATAVRVRQVADELGYRRNAYASGLRRGQTGTIGVLVPRLTDTVMALMFEALERAARARGYFAVVATCGDDPESERSSTEILLERGVDGLVLATARLDDELPAALRARGIRHSLALRTDGVSPSSLGDDDMGGYLAVRHLVDLGHRDIAIVTGPRFASSANGRVEGARRALAEAGLALDAERVVYAGYGIDEGVEAGRAVFTSSRPTAVFAANDNLAIGVMRAAHLAGRVVGDDLSLVGYNDIPLASRLPVPLTTVHVPFDQIAAGAIDLLFAPPGEATIRKVLPTLMPRASTTRVAE